ncbi:MAG: hypothetical protein K9N21_08340 [Deltaproteobacteria bacterium]|nr:hypothetical protein [Deltaproteobacteria bacterium]
MCFFDGSKEIGQRLLFVCVAVTAGLFFLSGLTVRAEYYDYSTGKPSAFRDYQQVMIWDSEVLEALSGFRGTLMFSTGSCFSGGFVDDLTKLPNAAVVTANNWHALGLSMYDFLPGQTDTWGFHDEYMYAFRRDVGSAPPNFHEAYLSAKDTIRTTDGYIWYWGGVEFPQFGASGTAATSTLSYRPGDRAILFSGMWAGNEYYITSWDYTIAGGRDLLINDYGWESSAITTLFSDGKVPPERSISWTLSGAGSKENLLNALKSAAVSLGPDSMLAVFCIAHGRSSGIMTSRLLDDRSTIEYLLIPNGRSIPIEGDTYPATKYGCAQVEITGLSDLTASHYTVTLPDSLSRWRWRIDAGSRSLFLEADDPSDQDLWLVPGNEYVIKLGYWRVLGESALGQGGWTLWMPEGGGGPPFKSDSGWSGGGEWGTGEHVPGGAGSPDIGSPDTSSWGHGWETGGDGFIWIPAPGGGSSDDASCFIRSIQGQD